MDSIFEDGDYMLWRLFTQARNAMMKARARELSVYGLSPRQAGVLLIAAATEGNATPYKMARWKVLEPHSVQSAVDRMQKLGLVEKIQNADSRGSMRVQLTDKGREAAAYGAKLQCIRSVFSCLSSGQREQLASILKIPRDSALSQLAVRRPMPYAPF